MASDDYRHQEDNTMLLNELGAPVAELQGKVNETWRRL
jgi:hypothetical protein